MKPMPLLAGLSVARSSWAPVFYSDHDVRPAEPSRWRTYQWAYRDTPSGMSPLDELRIRCCLERRLLSRGFQRCDPPELTIAFYVETAEPWYSGRDALVVEISDARTLATVWRGSALCAGGLRGAAAADLEEVIALALGEYGEGEEAPAAADEPEVQLLAS